MSTVTAMFAVIRALARARHPTPDEGRATMSFQAYLDTIETKPQG
ncbi:hypothetical protein [Microbacterium sp. VKM Ac-2870]|nr:hypothetical protein [Microbacterium sp. VKM Ac-2870]